MKIFLVSVAFLFVLLVSVFKIANYDIWWHLKAGEVIVNTHNVLKHDIFSYTSFGKTWINQHWLSQVIFCSIYELAGITGLIVFKTGIILIVFFLLLKLASILRSNIILTSFLIVLIAAMSSGRFYVRPNLFSILFFTIFIYILFKWRYSEKRNVRLVFLLPFCEVLWANLHAGAVIGIVLCFIFLIGELSQNLVRKKFKTKKHVVSLVIVSIAVVVAIFINPNTYRILIYPFQLTQSSLIKNVSEWLAPFSTQLKYAFFRPYLLAFFIIAAVSFIVNFKRLHVTDIILFIVFTYLALGAHRHRIFLGVALFPVILINLRSLSKYLEKKKAFASVCNLLLILFILYLSILVILNKTSYSLRGERVFGSGIQAHKYPQQAAEFINITQIKGNIFNSHAFGGYLIWKCFPEHKVFIDGRLLVYGEKLLNEYNSIESCGPNTEKLLNKYKITCMLLTYPSEAVKDISIHKFLYGNPDWKLVFWDEISIIYLKNVEENFEIISKYEYKFVHPLYIHTSKGEENYSEVIAEIKWNIDLVPNNYQAYNLLGILYAGMNKNTHALEAYNKALEIHPNSRKVLYNLGILLLKEGNYEKAIHHFNEAVDIDSNAPKCYFKLGICYMKTADFRKAARYFKKVLKTGDKDVQTYYNLGLCYYRMGIYQRAAHFYKLALKLDPDCRSANLGLELIEKTRKK
ncbi:MAG: tetratricopeptide repeat protein [bacterium]